MEPLTCICFAALISLGVVSSETVVPMYVRGLPQLFEAAQCNEGDYGNKCADCSTMLFCLGAAPVGTVVCVDQNRNLPYCVDDSCTDKIESGQSCKAAGDFKCTVDKGFLPDPKDCSVYHYCNKAGEEPETSRCPKGYVYDFKTTVCRQQKDANDCPLMTCEPGKVFVTYAPDKSVYGVCDAETNKPILFQCKDKSESFDETIAGCRFVCQGEGLFEAKDKAMYYLCYIDENNQLTASLEKCPGELEFDAKDKRCLPKKEDP